MEAVAQDRTEWKRVVHDLLGVQVDYSFIMPSPHMVGHYAIMCFVCLSVCPLSVRLVPMPDPKSRNEGCKAEN